MDWLIENNYIKNQNGKYIDLIVIGNKKKSKRKKYKLQENLYERYFSKGFFIDNEGKLIY